MLALVALGLLAIATAFTYTPCTDYMDAGFPPVIADDAALVAAQPFVSPLLNFATSRHSHVPDNALLGPAMFPVAAMHALAYNHSVACVLAAWRGRFEDEDTSSVAVNRTNGILRQLKHTFPSLLYASHGPVYSGVSDWSSGRHAGGVSMPMPARLPARFIAEGHFHHRACTFSLIDEFQ